MNGFDAIAEVPFGADDSTAYIRPVSRLAPPGVFSKPSVVVDLRLAILSDDLEAILSDDGDAILME